MFDWLFPQPQQNQHYRDVYVSSTRKGSSVIRIYSDCPVGQIEALRAADRELSLSPLEPGECRELKTYFDN